MRSNDEEAFQPMYEGVIMPSPTILDFMITPSGQWRRRLTYSYLGQLRQYMAASDDQVGYTDDEISRIGIVMSDPMPFWVVPSHGEPYS